jgi:ABC-type multidrug transport system ATPase subunit
MLSPQEGGVTPRGQRRRGRAHERGRTAVFSPTCPGQHHAVRHHRRKYAHRAEDATDEEIIDALKTACAWEFVETRPGGINGLLRERGRGISEGQAQRVSIARALIRRSPILLLDEATSALDIETEERVLHNIIRRDPGKVIIMATHRPSALKLCSRIYRITEDGITETDRAEAERLMRLYAELPSEAALRRGQRPVQLQAPLQPKEESEALNQNTNGSWWNV